MRPLRDGILSFTCFLGLTMLALYWPLLHVTTHIGGPWTTDYYHFHWNYWWLRHALGSGLNVYETNYVLFPFTTNLAYHTLTPFWYPLWALLEPLTGTLPAMAAVLVMAMSLSGFCAYLLFRSESVPAVLALPSGVLYMLTPAMLLAIMLSTINYASLFWYPLLLLLWGRVAQTTRLAGLFWAMAFGIALYGLVQTDYQHVLFAAVLLIPYGVLTLLQTGSFTVTPEGEFSRDAEDYSEPSQRIHKPQILRWSLIGRGLLAVGVALVLLWFVGPLPALLRFDRSTLSPMSIDKAQNIAFPQGYIGRLGTYDYRQITLGALIVPLLAIALMAAFTVLRSRDRRRWFWLALTAIPLILTPGAVIMIGDSAITTPYVAFHNLFGGLFRSPARFAPPLILAALIFIGRSFAPALAGRPHISRWIGVGGLLLVLGEARLYQPMPIQPVTPAYDFYTQIGQERGEPYDSQVIFEVPNAGGSGEAWVGEFRNMEAQFYGITHGKRMLNGSIARAPLNHFWYWLYDDPMIAWLGQRRYLEPETVAGQMRERIFGWPIGYFVVHQDWIGRDGPTNQEIIGWFNTLNDLLCPPFIERDAVVYRTRWHPDGCTARTPPESAPDIYKIDLGSTGDERYIGWGWHRQEDVGVTWRWTGEYPAARLYLDLPPGAYTLTLSAQAFHNVRTLTMLIGDVPLGEPVAVAIEGLQTFAFDLPADLVGDGQHLALTLAYDAVVVPRDVGQSADIRRLAVAVDWVQLERKQ